MMLLCNRLTRVNSCGANLMRDVTTVKLSRKFSQEGESRRRLPRVWEAPQGHKSNFTVYNTIAKRKTQLVLERQNVVKWYSCGPTVYDHSHMGHAYCYVRFDIIRRILESENKSVIYAMNITDIDDKIIRKSRELKRDWREVARDFEASFFADLSALNVMPPSVLLRVSDHMPVVIEFVQKLLESNNAYQISNGIYFDSVKDSGYPRFRIDEPWMESPKLSKEKRHPADCALWKFAKPGEPSWDTPFGAGRPGWHVECSALASKVFGSSVDLHSGGKDLEWPHHENEEAHSCVFHSCSNWAKFYLHSGHVHLDAKKMSKSLGNTLSIKDFLKTGTSDEFRMLCLGEPYRSDIEFTDTLRLKANRTLVRIGSILSDCDHYLKGKFRADINEEQLLQNLFLTQLKVRDSFRDDFNVPDATEAVLGLVQMLENGLEETDAYSASAFVAVSSLSDYIRKYFTMLGLNLGTKNENGENIDRVRGVLDATVKFRSDVRAAALAPESLKPEKLLSLCDILRGELKLSGIVVHDKSKERSTWTDEK